MIKPDEELKQVFAALGIEPGVATIYPKDQRPKKLYQELDDVGLLRWLHLMRAESPAKLVDEIRKRKLLPETELRQWLRDDPASA